MSVDQRYDEQNVLKRLAADDEAALAAIIDHYGSMVYGYFLRYLKDAGRAQELSQDLFMKIWQHRGRFPGMNNFAGYLYVALRHKASDAFREKVQAFETPPADHLAMATQPVLQPEIRELEKAIEEEINRLPPRRQEIFRMSRIEGLTYDEIAVRLGISKSTVREHMIEALAFLRSQMRVRHGIIISALLFISR